MPENKTYQLSRCYSELDGLQRAKTLTCSVIAKNGGSAIVLTSKSKENVDTETCLLPETPYERAKDIATMLVENSLEIGIWMDVLEEIGVKYVPVESLQLQNG